MAAALAGARNGAKVCSLEKCSLGGLVTLGNVIIYLPFAMMGRQVIGGIGENFKLSVRNPDAIPAVGEGVERINANRCDIVAALIPLPICWHWRKRLSGQV